MLRVGRPMEPSLLWPEHCRITEAGLGAPRRVGRDGDAVVSSNSTCFPRESGAVLEVLNRSFGRSAFVTATGRARSMLMTVGMPTATVAAVVLATFSPK